MKKEGKFTLLFILAFMLIGTAGFASAECTPPSGNIGGGDHCGQDWVISSNTEIAGNHTNISNFIINSGITAAVKKFDGTDYGWVEIRADNISINGTLDASGAGYSGGNGGAGASSSGGALYCGAAGNSGSSGSGSYSGSGGAGGNVSSYHAGGCSSSCTGRNGLAGANGISGKYCNGVTSSCDTSADESLLIGSGGGGGGGGSSGSRDGNGCNFPGGAGGGGGAGSSGGGIIRLYASNSIDVGLTGNIYSKGKNNGGDGGAGYGGTSGTCLSIGRYNSISGGSSGLASPAGSGLGGLRSGNIHICGTTSGAFTYGGNGGNGGAGAGGGILLKAPGIVLNGTIDNRGGNNNPINGGTLKLFCMASGNINGTLYYGRLYNVSACGLLVPMAICGNSIMERGEQCDDGNINDTDGCNSTCAIESGWRCSGVGPNSCTRLLPGINVFPVITSLNSSFTYGNFITFNASQSKVLNCSIGNCPAGQTCTIREADLHCFYAHAPGTKTITGNYNITVTWNVTNQAGAQELYRTGNWSNYTDVVEFKEYLLNPGAHNVRLRIAYIRG